MNNPVLLQSKCLSGVGGIRHGFFTRRGGESEGIFSQLNCGFSSGDDLDRVHQNRQAVADAMKVDKLFTLKQVHSRHVVVVGKDSDPSAVVEADGLVTGDPEIGLGALGADCAPVLFVDPVAKLIGAAHAGWKGALLGVTDQILDTMVSLGGQESQVVCAVGPAIARDSYEVGEAFRQRFLEQSPISAERFFHRINDSGSPESEPHFELPGYIEARLLARGIGEVEVLNEDTYRQPESFFSYRRSCHKNESGYGRQISVISLSV